MDHATHAVLNVARSVLGDLDVEVVLDRVLNSARAVTGARYAALGVLDHDGETLARFLTVGLNEDERRAIGPLPSGRGVLGELIRRPSALRLSDVGAHSRSYGFPLGHPPMSSFLGVPIVVAGEPYGNLYLTEKRDGSRFDPDDEAAVVLLAEFAGVAIDHARRFTGSEVQREGLQRTVAALDATLQISRALEGETDLNAILELVSKRGRALVSARTLVIELERGGELEVAAGAGELPAGLVGQRIKLEDTVASAALRTRQTQQLADELNRSRFEQHGLGRMGVHAKDGIAVPMIFRGRTYGVLVALDCLDSETGFTPDHQRLLESFASSAATAVATAETAAAERRRQSLAATESERARWARELHDETLQGMASLRLLLAAARRTDRPENIREAITRAIDQLDLDIGSLRGLIADLRPAALDQIGLEAALRALVDRPSDLDLDLDIDLAFEQGRARERLMPDIETATYRIVQEGMTNALKHGEAKRASVEVLERGGYVNIVLRDDGKGFDPSVATEGFGLIGMLERVELLDGTLSVASNPGRGSTITATLPARRASPKEQARGITSVG